MDEPTIVIAPDSFKHSLSSPDVAHCLEDGLRESLDGETEIVARPQSDGGPGMVDAIVESMNGRKESVTVSGPFGDAVDAEIGWFEAQSGDKTAVLEMAQASGIELLDEDELDPMKANTAGTGELILEAVHSGAQSILLGLGGSATVDGGIGAIHALGFKLLDENERSLEPIPENLIHVTEVREQNVPEEVRTVDLMVVCDVKNPLLGESGAVPVYAPQKGANDDECETLRAGMEHWAQVVERKVKSNLADRSMTGAAGGLGFPLVAFLGAELMNGAEFVMDVTNLNSDLQRADVLITGEGKIDRQTAFGKTPFAVAQRARDQKVPYVFGVTGEKETVPELDDVFHLILAIPKGPLTLRECLEKTDQLLRDTGNEIGRIIRML